LAKYLLIKSVCWGTVTYCGSADLLGYSTDKPSALIHISYIRMHALNILCNHVADEKLYKQDTATHPAVATASRLVEVSLESVN